MQLQLVEPQKDNLRPIKIHCAALSFVERLSQNDYKAIFFEVQNGIR